MFGMIESVEKVPRFPISVDVLSIEATAGASASCLIVVAEAREGPRDAEDISDARLLRPEALSSRSGGNIASRLLCELNSLREKKKRSPVQLRLNDAGWGVGAAVCTQRILFPMCQKRAWRKSGNGGCSALLVNRRRKMFVARGWMEDGDGTLRGRE